MGDVLIFAMAFVYDEEFLYSLSVRYKDGGFGPLFDTDDEWQVLFCHFEDDGKNGRRPVADEAIMTDTYELAMAWYSQMLNELSAMWSA